MPPHFAYSRNPRRLQFRLSSLLKVVAACGVFFGVLSDSLLRIVLGMVTGALAVTLALMLFLMSLGAFGFVMAAGVERVAVAVRSSTRWPDDHPRL
jgi:hypothetical protein